MQFKAKIALICAGIFIAGVGVGVVVQPIFQNLRPAQATASGALREKDANYKFISPLLLCGVTESKISKQYTELQSKVQSVIDQEKSQGHTTDVSVYFRDLNSGRWMGVNENEKFSPASLLKVPTMIATYKLAESDASVLTKKVTYGDGVDENVDENFKPAHPIQPRETYTVNQLLGSMIIESDNNARRLLHASIDPDFLKEVYTDLGISIPAASDAIDFMSTKTYSYFFRVLYNASYITREYSEAALSLLSKTDFAQGIVAGVPQGTVVAHKFGEREVVGDGDKVLETELHDCGIVYAAEHPYLLCVMTKGKDFNGLSKAIQAVSDVVYRETIK